MSVVCVPDFVRDVVDEVLPGWEAATDVVSGLCLETTTECVANGETNEATPESVF